MSVATPLGADHNPLNQQPLRPKPDAAGGYRTSSESCGSTAVGGFGGGGGGGNDRGGGGYSGGAAQNNNSLRAGGGGSYAMNSNPSISLRSTHGDGAVVFVPVLTHTVGADNNNVGRNNSARGNAFEALGNGTIYSFQSYLGLNSSGASCLLDFYVLSNTSSNPTASNWMVEWSSLGNAISNIAGDWQDSGYIGLAVTTGTYYGLLTAWQCSTGQVDYYFTNSAIGESISGFADFSRNLGINNGTYTAPLSGSTTLSYAGSGSSRARYYMQVEYAID